MCPPNRARLATAAWLSHTEYLSTGKGDSVGWIDGSQGIQRQVELQQRRGVSNASVSVRWLAFGLPCSTFLGPLPEPRLALGCRANTARHIRISFCIPRTDPKLASAR